MTDEPTDQPWPDTAEQRAADDGRQEPREQTYALDGDDTATPNAEADEPAE